MPHACDEDDAGVRGMHHEASNLLDIREADVLPGPAAVGRLEDAVADAEVRPVQALAAADIQHVGMRRGDRDVAHRARRRLIEDGCPGAAVVVGLPDAAVVDAHEEDAGLGRNPDRADRAAGPVRANHPVAQVLIERRAEGRGFLLPVGGGDAKSRGERGNQHGVSNRHWWSSSGDWPSISRAAGVPSEDSRR